MLRHVASQGSLFAGFPVVFLVVELTILIEQPDFPFFINPYFIDVLIRQIPSCHDSPSYKTVRTAFCVLDYNSGRLLQPVRNHAFYFSFVPWLDEAFKFVKQAIHFKIRAFSVISGIYQVCVDTLVIIRQIVQAWCHFDLMPHSCQLEADTFHILVVGLILINLRMYIKYTAVGE